MRTAFDDLSIVKHQDLVHFLLSNQPIGDHEQGMTLHRLKKIIEDLSLRGWIKVCSSLIE